MAATELLVWWTNQADCEIISAIYSVDDESSESTGPATWPPYLSTEYASRYGRNGRGRLWLALDLGKAEVNPWPKTPIADILGENYGGIVIRSLDLHHVAYLPGIVTDLHLRPVCEEARGEAEIKITAPYGEHADGSAKDLEDLA